MENNRKSFEFDPIVPFLFIEEEKENMMAALRKLRYETGIRRVLLVFPVWNGDTKGPNAELAYEKFGDLLCDVKQQLAADGMEIGWWCAPSLTLGPDADRMEADSPRIQHLVGIDGTVSQSACCPIDPDYQLLFSSYVRTITKKARPSIILFEDDYRLSCNYGVDFGCFCPRHLEQFSSRIGRQTSREELEALFSTGGEQAVEYRRLWAELMRDSLVELATRLRSTVNEIAPDTRMALCQPGMSDFDGDMTGPVARAFAGTTKPLVRLWGTSYRSDNADSLPEITFHMLYSKLALPEDFEIIHESDTYPHSRFFFSATKLRALIALSMVYGFDGSLSYLTQYTDGPLEEKGYTAMIKESHDFFTGLRHSVEGFRLTGPRVLYRPLAHVHRGSYRTTPAWAQVLGKFGIPCVPYTPSDAAGSLPLFVNGENVLELSPEEIMSMLSGSVFLDGLAAYYLCRMGYGELIGAEVSEMGPNELRDIGHERVTPANVWRDNTEGTRMYFSDQAGPREESGAFRLKPLADAVILSQFVSENREVVSPSVVSFTNRLQGRIAVLAFNLQANRNESILNYKRKEQFRGIAEWLGSRSLPVYSEQPSLFVVALEHPDNGMKMTALFNLSLDETAGVQLVTDRAWYSQNIEFLDDHGIWQAVCNVSWERNDDERYRLSIAKSCSTLRPLVFRFSN
ncbi:hypothetical protein [Cohnella soli]|uniref:Glycoside hydrolase family 42 N-terminal domain-containing protein n=1 Tax=Cohnella soli TaxID=425005 RepID=A0ABW0HKS7_9BACL